jgi:eukaryotic-like serine/threonine-protein kinase
VCSIPGASVLGCYNRFLDPTTSPGEEPVLPGQTLSHYTITGTLGAGAMGEVYRARDMTLNREVAIKVLPAEVAGNAVRIARFRREAHVLASLNHPNIAGIYGFEEDDGIAFLVLELVEGEDLAERLRHGPVPVREALEIAKQIAEALESAHERGVIHRDLKPANVKLAPSGTAKVLDFGLAKAYAGDAGTGMSSAQPSFSPTLTRHETAAGVLLGTAAYMSPEQMRGRTVDRRTDVWAFGVVLAEMLTGGKVFAGDTLPDLIAAVVTSDPDWSRLPPDTPLAVRRLLRRCLQRDLRVRLPDIGAARLELTECLAGTLEEDVSIPVTAPVPHAGRLRSAPLVGWVLAGLLGAAAAGAFFVVWRQPGGPQPEPRLQRLTLQTPPDLSPDELAPPVISPDGRYVAVVAAPGIRASMLWIRHLDSLTFEPLAGTEGTERMFWSPDSRFIGFVVNGQVKHVSLSGAVRTVCTLDSRYWAGGTWGSSGVIVIAKGSTLQNDVDARSEGAPATLATVSVSTGQWEPLTRLDASRGETGHYWPQFLPDGRHIAFQVNSTNPKHRGVFITSLDAPQERRRLLSDLTTVAFVHDRVVFVRGNTLLGQRVDAKTWQVTGEPVPIAEGVDVWADGSLAMFSTASDGTVVYTPARTPNTRIAWVDRNGVTVTSIGPPQPYGQVALSPDEKRAAVELRDADGRYDIWLLELARGLTTRVTFDAADDRDPVWSPDGSALIFDSNRTGLVKTLFRKDLASDHPERPLFETKENLYPESWTPDGKAIVYVAETTAASIWRLDGSAAARQVLRNGYRLDEVQISPDGNLLAYNSAESGHSEVYIQRLGRAGEKVRVSTEGGGAPKWRRDGKELFYVAPNRSLMAVQIMPGVDLAVGLPQPLFDLGDFQPDLDEYAPSRDGQRFLVKIRSEPVSSHPIQLVLNWRLDNPESRQ